jgi:hypothetical protein
VVALRRPSDLPAPWHDGLPTPAATSAFAEKMYHCGEYLGGLSESTSETAHAADLRTRDTTNDRI